MYFDRLPFVYTGSFLPGGKESEEAHRPLAFGALVPAAAASELVERVIARVNDDIITQSQLDTRVERVRKDPQAPTESTRSGSRSSSR